jgi:hypothetical protein
MRNVVTQVMEFQKAGATTARTPTARLTKWTNCTSRCVATPPRSAAIDCHKCVSGLPENLTAGREERGAGDDLLEHVEG